MVNTSMGVHTVSWFQWLKEREYFQLTVDFDRYMRDSGELKRQPIKAGQKIVGWEYTYIKPKGIRWILKTVERSPNYFVYYVMIVITPKVLAEGNYITVANEADLGKIEGLFNLEANKISPIIKDFGMCSANRCDPGLTFDTEELELPCSSKQMMTLFDRGDIPAHFKKRIEYDDKHRPKKANKDSIYLMNGSLVINIYRKYQQQNEKHPNYLNRENTKNVIRFEIQCKQHKLYAMSKNFKDSRYFVNYDELSEEKLWENIDNDICNPTIPLDMIFSDNVSKDIVGTYFHRVVRDGDYLTLDCARWIVQEHNFRRDKEERLIFALEQINEHRGIAKAKSKMIGTDLSEFKRSLKDLDEIDINPVTIPREWEIERIRNPLRAYYEHSEEEMFTTSREMVFENLLARYQSNS